MASQPTRALRGARTIPSLTHHRRKWPGATLLARSQSPGSLGYVGRSGDAGGKTLGCLRICFMSKSTALHAVDRARQLAWVVIEISP